MAGAATVTYGDWGDMLCEDSYIFVERTLTVPILKISVTTFSDGEIYGVLVTAHICISTVSAINSKRGGAQLSEFVVQDLHTHTVLLCLFLGRPSA